MITVQQLMIDLRLRGLEMAKLQQRIANQRVSNRNMQAALRIAAQREVENDKSMGEAERLLLGAKQQIERLIAHNQLITKENTTLKSRNTELEILHNIADNMMGKQP